jgi:uncharacterized membrane protein YphA (DoxX/SURF4 family)
MKITTIIYLLLSLFVGGMMCYGGYQKFAKPIPAPTQMIETFEKEGVTKLKENIEVLQIKNYIFGMKQTNYFWQLLGICELLFGIMVLSQVMRFMGAVLLLPISLHIFLFHVFLEPNDLVELLQTALLLLANIALVAKEYPKWKSLVFIKFI